MFTFKHALETLFVDPNRIFFFRNDDIEDSPTNNLLGLIIDQNLI